MYNLTFDEDGDVVLMLPLPNLADHGGTTRFQVNSNALCLASPVFRAMLGKNSSFKEAKALVAVNSGATSAPFDLPLDDDPNAFAIILRILHYQLDLVPLDGSVDEEQLYKMAIICDKYNMVRALGYWFRKWTSSISESPQATGDSSVQNPVQIKGLRWLFMSYAFAHQELFKRLSLELILNCEQDSLSMSDIENEEFGDYIPQPIINAILVKRRQAIDDLLACVQTETNQLINPDPSFVFPPCNLGQSTCEEAVLGALIVRLRTLNVYPKASIPVAEFSVMGLLNHLKLLYPTSSRSKPVLCCPDPQIRQCHQGYSYCSDCVKCANCGRRLRAVPTLLDHLAHCYSLSRFLNKLQDIVDQIPGLDHSRFVRDKTQPPPEPATDRWKIIPYS